MASRWEAPRLANEPARIVDIAAELVERARRAGAEQCDVIVNRYTESTVTVRLGELEKVIEAGSQALGLRVINGGRTAVCSTTDFHSAALDQFVRDTIELANISAPDEFAGLPSPSDLARPGADGLQLYDEAVAAMTTDERIALARDCEAAALGFDARITNTDGGSVSSRFGEVALANSLGFAAFYPSTMVSMVVEVMADDADGKKRNAYWFSSERSKHRLASPEEVGRIAARRALDQVGACKVKTTKAPIVFEPRMSAQLMGSLAGCASGSALYRGATFLQGRTGEQIASPLLTLVDRPLEPGRGASRPFDGEGVATRNATLLDKGVFQGFLFDSYTGRRTQNETTGSAQRGIDSLPSPGTSNLILLGGETPPDEIIRGVEQGLYLTELFGFGFNPTTGDFSRGAGGFWIENGEIAFPVTEINISGTMGTMLSNVDALGNDLTWFSSSAAPTLRISEMTISGL